MATRETENNTYATFLYLRVTNKEHYMVCYGMLWYFLEWSIGVLFNFLFIACVAGGIISVRESFGGGGSGDEAFETPPVFLLAARDGFAAKSHSTTT